jgi:NAD(P)-dependent dehydrogenase (short-subunit alcohol dehydrogenase family)
MKACLVTGSSGLIGEEICREFLARGFHVYGLDLRSPKDLDHKKFTFIKCDVSKEVALKAAFKKLKHWMF